MQYVCFNGAFLPAQQALFSATNRGFKYGDGLFETARFYQGRLLLATAHEQRLFSGLQLLNITTRYAATELLAMINGLCEKNECGASARVRLAIYREADNTGSVVIEAQPLSEAAKTIPTEGWRLTVYPTARKSCDPFANLKSANYLLYVMAAQYAQQQGADESLVLNVNNRICDGSKTNLFYRKGIAFYTPALSEGGVAGVMRQTVIQFLEHQGYSVHQQPVTPEQLTSADEIFMTNAIEGWRWVQQYQSQQYGHEVLKKLHLAFYEHWHNAV